MKYRVQFGSQIRIVSGEELKELSGWDECEIIDMEWTRKPPTEAGYYFVRCDNEPKESIVEFTGKVFNTFGQIGLDLEQVTDIYDVVFWYGPLDIPEVNFDTVEGFGLSEEDEGSGFN